ncbi:MAG: hypothetical protein ACRC3Y_03640 [Romboutsia sp.]|uniref:hypothetical protein n=1 Tax=Romboutsia sp. TaxID=1965302 RepID=UPI003F3BFE77
MLINIGNHEFTEVWDGVLYKKLSNYPDITDWEIRNIIEFIEYEKEHRRECKIICENEEILYLINKAKNNKEKYKDVLKPEKITECTACPKRKGCMTDLVCHTTSLDNAMSILKCGKLLSAINVRKVPIEQLITESRNAAGDPADYFEYIMFAWGNCQAGDRLVMERELGHFPTDEDLSVNFTPGIRFYFQYNKLIQHPACTYDGVLPMKVKDEVILKDWMHKIVIPLHEKENIQSSIPEYLNDKVLYVKNDCNDIWEWSEKVYTLVSS